MITYNKSVFITGGTGYVGSRLIPLLINNGYAVNALVRSGSQSRLPAGCSHVIGNALDSESFKEKIVPCETFIQLVGVSHPGPGKKILFREIDLVSVTESVKAAAYSGVKHFIYISVAHPAPVMHDYINVRKEGEDLIIQSGMNTTIFRPWYILGPGHYWPYILLPFYKLFELFPYTKRSARRLGLININSMINSILYAVENPSKSVRIITTEKIKEF